MVKKNFLLFLLFTINMQSSIYIPISSNNRKDVSKLQLTVIGKFGLLRKARATVPSHLHTGIDIKRPTNNYINEPIFAIAKGVIISIRDDGPYAQVIIEHTIENKLFWSVYEHVSGINVALYENVSAEKAIARFMNKNELNKYGWQFDHFHFEILKEKPTQIKPDKSNPKRHYKSYTLICHSINELEKHYYNPIEFLNKNLN